MILTDWKKSWNGYIGMDLYGFSHAHWGAFSIETRKFRVTLPKR